MIDSVGSMNNYAKLSQFESLESRQLEKFTKLVYQFVWQVQCTLMIAYAELSGLSVQIFSR